MNPDLGPYCLQYRSLKHKQTRGADDKSHDGLARVKGLFYAYAISTKIS